MIGAFVAFPLFAEPYERTGHYTFAHESSPEFTEYAEAHDRSAGDAVLLAQYSAVERQLVTDAIASAEADGNARATFEYEAGFCRENLLRCDGYDERPTEALSGSHLVEVDGEVYLIETTSNPSADPGVQPSGSMPYLLFAFAPTVACSRSQR